MQRRELDFQTFEQVLADIEHLRSAPCAHVGQWDLAQTIGHLVRAINGSMDGFKFKAPWILRKLVRRIAWRQVMKTRRIRPGFKVKGLVLPDAGAEVAPLVDKLRDAMARFKAHQGPFLPHPFFEKLDKEQWRQLHLIHCAHHLSFQIPR